MSSNKMTPEDLKDVFDNAHTVTFCSHNKKGSSGQDSPFLSIVSKRKLKSLQEPYSKL